MEKRYVKPRKKKEPETVVTSAGMRREKLFNGARIYEPTEESVIEEKEWCETHQQ